MMHRRLIIAVLFLAGLAQAQGGWKRRYLPPGSQSSFAGNVFETPAGNFVMTGLSYENIHNDAVFRLTIVVTDPLGQVLHLKRYGSSKFSYLNAFSKRNILNDDTHFYITDCVRDSNNRQIGVLIKCNFQGDTLWQKIYREAPPRDVVPVGLTKSVDSGFLITGFSQDVGTTACLLIKTDANGNELWRKRIGKAVPDVQSGNAIVQDSATKKILIVGYQYIGTSSYSETYSNILILDSLGNTLKRTTFNNNEGGPFNEIVQLKDKNFLTCGSVNANSDFGFLQRYHSVVVKFDIDGNILWKTTYDTLGVYNRIDQLHERANGDIIMSGILDTMLNYNQPEICKVKMFRIDSTGHVKWRKYIGSSYDYYSGEGLCSMRPTRDGGYIFATGFPNMNDPKPYSIVKTDSTGCDTLEAWCRSVALGLADHNRISGFKFSVFPNPASQFAVLNCDAPPGINIAIRIQDLSGKDIYTCRLRGGKEQSVDLSGYAPGVYLVTLLQNQKAVESRKLVILK